jgi:hypothetical protein
VEGEEMKFMRSWTPVGAKKPSGACMVEASEFTESKGYTKEEIKEIVSLPNGHVWQYKETRPGYPKETIMIKRVE